MQNSLENCQPSSSMKINSKRKHHSNHYRVGLNCQLQAREINCNCLQSISFYQMINNKVYKFNMLEYLILNRKFQSAKHFQETNRQNFMEILLQSFTKGHRQQFFGVYSLLKKQLKLEFYLRVYFFIYSIHPATSNFSQNTKPTKQAIPQAQLNAFKDFIDNRGAELAKTNQFLEFYALPYIKKPLEHQAFKNIFKKQWVGILKQKLTIFLNQESKRLKNQSSKLQATSSQSMMGSDRNMTEKVKEMQKINQQLFDEVKQFAEKCQILEEGHQMMAEGFHTHMMEAQSKWFQITKQLVDCSKSLISMLIAENSDVLGDRKFLKVKKRTEKYEKFVNNKFQDLVSHSQEISIFDRPSINELSCSVMPYTQKSNGLIVKDISAIIGIDQFIPTNFIALQKHFKKSGVQQKNSIMNGFTYRISKSKDKLVKRLNISGIFKSDILGFNSGQISQLLASHQLMRSAVKLILIISQDSYGRKLLFISNNIHRDFISLMHSCNDKKSLQGIMSMLSVISSQKKFKLEIIELDIIEGCINLLRKGKQDENEAILETVTTILLNTIMVPEGLHKFERQKDIFQILKKYVRCPYKLVKTFVYGIIYSLLESQSLFRLANAQKLNDFFYKLPEIDSTISKQQITLLKQKIAHFHPKQVHIHEDQEDEESDDDDDDYPMFDIDQFAKNHDELINKFSLNNKQAKKQYKQMKQFYEQMKSMHNVPKFHQPKNTPLVNEYNSPKNSGYHSKNQQETPYIKEIQSNSNRRKIDNFVSPSQKQEPLKKNRDFRIKDKDMNKINISRNKEEDNCGQRMRKSVSADRGIGRSRQKEDIHIYESNRIQRNRVSEFKNSEERGFRSPQGKKVPREQVLKQLNEQLQAGQIKRKKDLAEGRIPYHRRQTRTQKTQPQEVKDYDQAFLPRPKIKRSPPKQQK